MKQNKINKKEKIFKFALEQDKKFLLYSAIIGLVLLTITIYRAITTNITYDEAYTYFHYVPRNPFKIIAFLNIKGTFANNHLANSFLISCLEVFFGHNFNEFIIRLPNILCYVVFLSFSYLICKDTKYKYFNFALFVLNYGANEFFGLARGYGIACAFVLVGIYFFKTYLTQNKNYFLTLSYFSLLIACYTNTSSLIAYASIIFASFISLIKDKKLFEYAKNQIYFLIPIIIASLLIIRYHFLVTSEGLPLYGATGKFYNAVLVSFLYIYGMPNYLIPHFVNALIFVLIAILFNKLEKFKNSYIVFAGILYFVLLIGLTKGTGKPWITGRCLIPSMPLLTLCVIEIFEKINIKRIFVMQTIFIIALSAIFIRNFDIKATREWKDNYSIKEICYEALKTKTNEKVLEILEIEHNPAIHFYKEKILKEENYDIFQ